MRDFRDWVARYDDVQPVSLGQLVDNRLVKISGGHGSPSLDQRLGDIPYIKVSDLRAGHVNINPSNMIPEALAKRFWGSEASGLHAYDLISPERASKNIGEFCVLMPGQERVVLTKEVIVVRAIPDRFDQFYLMWALSLAQVRRQWDRIVVMQTNREDVGKRILEIEIPLPDARDVADKYAEPFRHYFEDVEENRRRFAEALANSGLDHHIFWGDGDSLLSSTSG